MSQIFQFGLTNLTESGLVVWPTRTPFTSRQIAHCLQQQSDESLLYKVYKTYLLSLSWTPLFFQSISVYERGGGSFEPNEPLTSSFGSAPERQNGSTNAAQLTQDCKATCDRPLDMRLHAEIRVNINTLQDPAQPLTEWWYQAQFGNSVSALSVLIDWMFWILKTLN